MRSRTLRRWWLAPVAATALLLGLTNPATGRPSGDVLRSPLTGKVKVERAAGAATTSGHHGGVTVVADYLNNPRGLDLRHGTLYVAEAGRGGDTCIGDTPEEQTCVGLTSAITRVRHGHQRRIVRGLLSAAGPAASSSLALLAMNDDPVARPGWPVAGLVRPSSSAVTATGASHQRRRVVDRMIHLPRAARIRGRRWSGGRRPRGRWPH